MREETVVKVTGKRGEEVIKYYIYNKLKEESEFNCVMYNVGIEENGKRTEIDDFSPDEDEARRLMEALCENTVRAGNLFSAAEEFIVNV